MAANKRLAIKHIRDGAKSAYNKKDHCYICKDTALLELHHLTPLTRLLEVWARKNKFDISTDEGVLEIRDLFISSHQKELYELVYTLCKMHHAKLHGVYGKSPEMHTVDKQQNWIDRQKEKLEGNTSQATEKPKKKSFFGEFLG